MSDIRRCGFCGILTGFLRRVMCVGNRRGSSESCYRELGDQETLRFDQKSDDASDTSSSECEELRQPDFARVSIKNRYLYGPRKTFSEELASILFEDGEQGGMAVDCYSRGPNGPFHSMRRDHRRQTLTDDATAAQEAMLDQSYPMTIELLLARSSKWDFDTHDLDRATGGQCLPYLGMHLFDVYGLINCFKLVPEKCMKLFKCVQNSYVRKNPYHNAIHAADVTQAIHCFLQQPILKNRLAPLEVMVALLAAITHDLDHPGVNHSFLVATGHPLAIMFNDKKLGQRDRGPRRGRKGRKIQQMLMEMAASPDVAFTELKESPKPKRGFSFFKRNIQENPAPPCESILEHHHWRAAYSVILESGIFDHMQEKLPEIQEMLKSLILATDITRQNEYLEVFKDHLSQNKLDMDRADHRHIVLQMALKTADISNPGRPWSISKRWSHSVCDEFYQQGDKEMALNLKVSNLCDREKDTVPKIQRGFFTFVVTPLFTEWDKYLNSKLSKEMLKHLVCNAAEWAKEDVRSEATSKSITQSALGLSDADMVENELESSTNLSGSTTTPVSRSGLAALLFAPGMPRRGSDNPRKPNKTEKEQDGARRNSAPAQNFLRYISQKRGSAPKEPPSAAAAAGIELAGFVGKKQTSMLEIAMVIASVRYPEPVPADAPSDDLSAPDQLIDLSSPRRLLLGYAVQVNSDDEDDEVSSEKGGLGIGSVIIEESSISSGLTSTTGGNGVINGHGSSSISHQFLLPALSTHSTSAPSSESHLDHQMEDVPAAKTVASSCELITFTPMKAVAEEMKDVLFPQLRLAELGQRRRGSAPAPSALSDMQRLASTLSLQLGRRKQSGSTCHQWVTAEGAPAIAGGLARRGSLPVEVMTGIST